MVKVVLSPRLLPHELQLVLLKNTYTLLVREVLFPSRIIIFCRTALQVKFTT